ncbi:hypothetical protein [Marinicrinis sediminis]|uniref:LytTR family transcriptional regulator n=1 Tax=Marinicrinis sediminis TaxID=1652465 RepID=A0ABW5RB32_9BACL
MTELLYTIPVMTQNRETHWLPVNSIDFIECDQSGYIGYADHTMYNLISNFIFLGDALTAHGFIKGRSTLLNPNNVIALDHDLKIARYTGADVILSQQQYKQIKKILK